MPTTVAAVTLLCDTVVGVFGVKLIVNIPLVSTEVVREAAVPVATLLIFEALTNVI